MIPVAVVVLLCQAVAWVHAAAIPHVTCLEHGESVHLSAARAKSAPAAEVRGEATIASTAAEPDAHAHDHCTLQAQRSTSTAAPALDSAVASFAPVSLPPLAAVPSALGLLRLAPKTSPPPAPAA